MLWISIIAIVCVLSCYGVARLRGANGAWWAAIGLMFAPLSPFLIFTIPNVMKVRGIFSELVEALQPIPAIKIEVTHNRLSLQSTTPSGFNASIAVDDVFGGLILNMGGMKSRIREPRQAFNMFLAAATGNARIKVIKRGDTEWPWITEYKTNGDWLPGLPKRRKWLRTLLSGYKIKYRLNAVQ